MVSFGRFRIVPTVRQGKAVFEVKSSPGNISFGVFPTIGLAASRAIKLHRAEIATRKAAVLIRDAGIQGGKILQKLSTEFSGRPLRRKRRKRRK